MAANVLTDHLALMCLRYVTHPLLRGVFLVFCLLFSTSYWCGEWVGVIYMCPHPPASFRIRVECHFLSLFPRLPSLFELCWTLPAISTQPYSSGCEVSSHLATQTDTFLQQAEPSESAWSAFSCALRSKLWAIRSPLGSIIHVQGAWTTQLHVQYIQTICLMTQPSAWSNCILPHSVVSFSETEGPVISILPCSLCFVDGWSVATLSQHCNCLIFGWLPV